MRLSSVEGGLGSCSFSAQLYSPMGLTIRLSEKLLKILPRQPSSATYDLTSCTSKIHKMHFSVMAAQPSTFSSFSCRMLHWSNADVNMTARWWRHSTQEFDHAPCPGDTLTTDHFGSMLYNGSGTTLSVTPGINTAKRVLSTKTNCRSESQGLGPKKSEDLSRLMWL